MSEGRIKILRAEVDAFKREEVLELVRSFLDSAKNHHIVTLNSEMIVRCEKDANFKAVISRADLVVADGAGVLRAAEFLKKKQRRFLPDLAHLFLITFYSIVLPEKARGVLPEKISGIDLVYEICGSDFACGKRIYLLGGGEGIAQKTEKVLKSKFPNIDIAGAEAGFFNDPGPEENAKILERINLAHPDILFVALGAPKQEKWIRRNLEKMPSVRVAMGVGGSFDVICGKIRRAPRFWQSHGLEWLWRLLMQPRRLGRICNATLRLSWLIFRDKEAMIRK